VFATSCVQRLLVKSRSVEYFVERWASIDGRACGKHLRGRLITARIQSIFSAPPRPSFRHRSVEVVRRDAALKTLCIIRLFDNAFGHCKRPHLRACPSTLQGSARSGSGHCSAFPTCGLTGSGALISH